MTIYCVANGKGGAGKTTASAELARSLALHGRRVCAWDQDQQANLSRRLGVTDDTPVHGDVMDVLTNGMTATQAAVPSAAAPGVDIIVGSHAIADADRQHPEIVAALRDYLPTLTEWDDHVLDTPGDLGLVTLGALAAANVVIAAVACETESWEQFSRLEQVIDARVAPRLRPGQAVHWVIPGRYDARRVLDGEILAALQQTHDGKVTSPIRETVAVRDAYTAGMPVSVYAPRSTAALDYADALGPILRAGSLT